MINMGKKVGVMVESSVSFFILSGVALADSGPITLTDPLGGKESFQSVATNVASFLLNDIAIPLSVIMVLVGAFQIMTAGGDPEKFSTGRKTITYAAIGLVLAFIATGITNLIKNFLGQS